jgi:hypothetical protein
LFAAVSAVGFVDFFQNSVIFAETQNFVNCSLGAWIKILSLVDLLCLGIFLNYRKFFGLVGSISFVYRSVFKVSIDLFNRHFDDIGVAHCAVSTRANDSNLLALFQRIA